jgi:hypothetical protein
MSEKYMKTKSSVLHKAFCTYTGTDWSPVQFSNAMFERGFTKRTSVGSVYWEGVGLNVAGDHD